MVKAIGHERRIIRMDKDKMLIQALLNFYTLHLLRYLGLAFEHD